jgi:trk system potassium uptake protein TrkA
MKKRFAVIGLGLFGWEVATTLAEMGAEVIAIDKNWKIVEKIKEHVLIAVQLDSKDQESLEAQDLKNVDAAIVGIGADFEECLLTVVVLKQMGIPKVIARAGTKSQKLILEKVGCDLVVLLEEDMGRRIAKILISELFLDRIGIGDQYSIVQMPAPQEFIGKKIIELHVREEYHVNIVTIKSRVVERTLWGKETVREAVKAVPGPEDQIQEEDVLVLFGHDRDLEKLAELFEK